MNTLIKTPPNSLKIKQIINIIRSEDEKQKTIRKENVQHIINMKANLIKRIRRICGRKNKYFIVIMSYSL